MFGAAPSCIKRHTKAMFGHEELRLTLSRLKEEGRATNAEISRVLGLPSSRVAEIFDGSRQIKLDEAKTLVEHYHLEQNAPQITGATIEPLLDAVLPLAPTGKASDQSRRALAEALAYGIGLLGKSAATPTSEDAMAVAARAAAHRFRETVLQS